MLGEALRFPIEGDDGLKNILIGGLLVIFGFLLIPIFLVQGYTVRVLRVAVDGGEEPPSFDEWGEMLVDGLKLFIIAIAYFLVPMVLFLVSMFAFVGIASVSSAGGEPAPGALAGAGIVGLLLISVSMLLFVVASYLLPAAAANFARTDEFGAAFDVGTVIDGAFSADYLVAVVFAILVGIIFGTITFVLSIIIIGLLVVPFVSFYSQVATYHLFGRGFAKGLGLDEGGGSTATPTTTVE